MRGENDALNSQARVNLCEGSFANPLSPMISDEDVCKGIQLEDLKREKRVRRFKLNAGRFRDGKKLRRRSVGKDK